MTREVTTHQVGDLNEALVVQALDEPGAGGASHRYRILLNDPGRNRGSPLFGLAELGFQNGAIQEEGMNGITNEVLLAIVLDRLQGFQQGPLACRENALALTRIEEALLWLQHRTRQRQSRRVEGTHQP